MAALHALNGLVILTSGCIFLISSSTRFSPIIVAPDVQANPITLNSKRGGKSSAACGKLTAICCSDRGETVIELGIRVAYKATSDRIPKTPANSCSMV